MRRKGLDYPAFRRITGASLKGASATGNYCGTTSSCSWSGSGLLRNRSSRSYHRPLGGTGPSSYLTRSDHFHATATWSTCSGSSRFSTRFSTPNRKAYGFWSNSTGYTRYCSGKARRRNSTGLCSRSGRTYDGSSRSLSGLNDSRVAYATDRLFSLMSATVASTSSWAKSSSDYSGDGTT